MTKWESRSGKVYGPEERNSVYDALRGAPIEGAYQFFEEVCRSSIEEGKLADFVILDKSPLEVDLDAVKDIVVLETIKEGETVLFEVAVTDAGSPPDRPMGGGRGGGPEAAKLWNQRATVEEIS